MPEPFPQITGVTSTPVPFDPAVLERSIIALPLWREMKKDLDLITWLEKERPDLDLKKYNAAIVYRTETDFEPGGSAYGLPATAEFSPEAAYERVKKMARQAGRKALSAIYTRIQRFEDAGRGKEEIDVEKERKQKLRLAITAGEQLIEFPKKVGAYYVSLARLHASVIRRMHMAKELEDRDARTDEERRKQPSVIEAIVPERFEIIIDLNLEYPGGRDSARTWVFDNIEAITRDFKDAGQEVFKDKSAQNKQYVFARLDARSILELLNRDLTNQRQGVAQTRASRNVDVGEAKLVAPEHRAIYHIWPDFPVSSNLTRSCSTVKADAAQKAFAAAGEGIVWAVIDSGIDQHEHFFKHLNLDVNQGWHRDFTTEGANPLRDEFGHGTHVAGIIAGEYVAPPETRRDQLPFAVSRYHATGGGGPEYEATPIKQISGVAPKCKLVSLKVLDENGMGSASNLIAAITHIQEINGYGRRILIHGVNLSVGYSFEPEWFACGQSPLCVEVNKLVKSGVCVVVSAGNTGYGKVAAKFQGPNAAGIALTINDPGNADLAITVGSTHRDQPHTYGVSYFSSKGPTGDGRLKPDLVAPGEKIISCASAGSWLVRKGTPSEMAAPHYIENSGTSMAAPHVSGAIAAFLSVRGEFREQPEKVKQIFLSTATDLKRDRYFQGAGLVDLMRAIQSV